MEVKSRQLGTVDADFPRIRYAVPSLMHARSHRLERRRTHADTLSRFRPEQQAHPSPRFFLHRRDDM